MMRKLSKFLCGLLLLCLCVLYTVAHSDQTADTNAGTGTAVGTWANPGNITSSDNVWATESASTQDPIEAETFGFSIPAGVSIDEIKVKAEGNSDGGSFPERNIKAQITKNGTSAVGEFNVKTLPSGTDATLIFNPSSPIWDLTWTVSEINASTFGVFISHNSTATQEIRIDNITIAIFFTVPGSGRRRRIMMQESSPLGTPITTEIGYEDVITGERIIYGEYR